MFYRKLWCSLALAFRKMFFFFSSNLTTLNYMGHGVATPTVNDQSLSSFFCFQFSHFYCFLAVSAGNHLDATCQTVCPARRFSPPCADGRADKRRKCFRRRLSSSSLSGGVFQKMKRIFFRRRNKSPQKLSTFVVTFPQNLPKWIFNDRPAAFFL